MVSELQKAKGFKGVIAATRKTTPGKTYNQVLSLCYTTD